MTDNLHKRERERERERGREREKKEPWTGIHVMTETVRVSPP